jgi:hypothetical protein
MNARQQLAIIGMALLVFLSVAWLGWRARSAVNGGPEDPGIRAVEWVGGECRRPAYYLDFDGFKPGWLQQVDGTPVIDVDFQRSTGRVTNATLAAMSPLKEVRRLCLHRAAGVTDEGLKSLASLARLRELTLFQTKVTDAGMKHVAALAELEELSLSSTAVTDAGLKHLTGLRA